MEKPQQKIGEEHKYEQMDKDQLARLLAERDLTIADLRAALTKKESSVAPSILCSELPETQREVLQAILDLPEDEFAEAEKLMEPLIGQPMNEVFANSFKAALQKKGWGVVCETCKAPSTIAWRKDVRYESNGYAQFTHTGASSHGCITKVRLFNLILKRDRRRTD